MLDLIEKDSKNKQVFKTILKAKGLSNESIDELYKWYDSSEKKGVASF